MRVCVGQDESAEGRRATGEMWQAFLETGAADDLETVAMLARWTWFESWDRNFAPASRSCRACRASEPRDRAARASAGEESAEIKEARTATQGSEDSTDI